MNTTTSNLEPNFAAFIGLNWADAKPSMNSSGKYYEAQRAKGKSHNQAVLGLAFKWIRILWACWTSNRPYDQTTYLKALQKSGSPYAIELPVAA